MKGISGRLIKGSLWVGVSRALVNLLGMLSLFVLARLLTPSDFGLVALGTTLLVIATTVTELSLNQALVRHPSPQPTHFDAAWTLNGLRGLVLWIAFAALAVPAARLFDEPRLTGIMLVLGFGIFLNGLSNPKRIMLQRDLIFWQEFVLNVSQKLAGVIASVAIAVIYRSYWALVAGVLATHVTGLIVSYTSMPHRPKICFRHLKELFSFSAWLTAGQIINTLSWRLDYLLIAKFLGQAPLGLYSVGNNLAMMPTREITAPLTKTIFPGFANIMHDPARLAAGYQRVQSFVTAVALPMGIGVAVIADPLIRLAIGEKWVPAIFILQALAAIFALQTLGSQVQALAMAQGETRLLFVRSTQMLLIRLPLIVGGMFLFGLKGLVIGRVISGLVQILVDMTLVRRLTALSLGRQLGANVRALVSAAGMAAAVLSAQQMLPQPHSTDGLVIELAVLTSTGLIAYIALMLVSWLIAGRPPGPEQEVIAIVRQAFLRVRSAGSNI